MFVIVLFVRVLNTKYARIQGMSEGFSGEVITFNTVIMKMMR